VIFAMSTTEEPQKLYAAREPVFPKRVSGKFRNLKWIILIVTLGIYYVTPWIRFDRGPNLPDQAVLLDLANRRFFFFWIEIWPHEFYFVAGLLIMAGLGLFLFTSALGRVWCGYTCPQTVWTDLFFTVERWIEGDRNARLRLWRSDMDFRKFRLRVTKYAAWLAIAVATGGAWVFYFADAPTLLRDLVTLQAAPVAYITIAILTATTFVFGGFMREQICIYACPWPRIQAAMMDEDTITVAYRDWRGEPRGKGKRRRDDHRRGPRRDHDRDRARGYRGAGRLHRLQRLRERLPRGHRHPRRPAAGMHHLRALHRCLRRHHGQDRQAARPDRLSRADRRGERARGQPAQARLEAHLPPAHADLHGALVGGGHRPCRDAVHPLGYRRDGGARAQPAIRDPVGRLDP
jgi:hypothetical protein